MTLEMMRKSARCVICMVLIAVMCFSSFALQAAADELDAADDASAQTGTVKKYAITQSFDEYISSHKDAKYPEIADTVATFKGATGEGFQADVSHNGVDGAYRVTQKQTKLNWNVNVADAGFYAVKLSCSQDVTAEKISQYTLYVNGESINRQTELVKFPREYVDEGEIEKDASGSDIRPKKVAIDVWTEFYIADGNYNVDGWMPVYLNSGSNELSLLVDSEGMYLTNPIVCQPKSVVSYKDYLAANDSKKSNVADDYCEIYQAEHSYRTSSTELYPTYDRTDPMTVPNDAYVTKLNTIGQNTWDDAGQWIEWEINVPEDGYYNIGMRARQNVLRGVSSSRRLYIDGKICFDECNTLSFPYDMQWYMTELGNGKESYKFYLTKGKHILRMESVLGALGDRVISVEAIASELNSLYRKIIMITGTSNSVDTWRDYMLEKQIPNLMEDLKSLKDRMLEEIELFEEVGVDGEYNMSSLLYMIDNFLKNSEKIPTSIDSFRSNITSLSAWALSLKSQPLELDYIYLKSAKAEAPSTKGNFFSKLAFRFEMLLASYVTDYASVSGNVEGKESIRVWTTTGRDQAQAILDLINNRFTPETSVSVELSIMQAGINESVAAGRNPDVLIHSTADAIQLAARDVLTDISKYSKFDEIKNRFGKNSFIPYIYEDGVYGVPLTQNPMMMFYRKDILNELEIELPKTWDELMNVMTILQNNKLTVGLSAGNSIVPVISMFELLVYQNNGRILSEDLQSTVLDNEVTYKAFEQWTKFFTKYSLEPEIVSFERFRSGEVPLAILDIATYSQLKLGAPEIDGLWDMAPVPQTVLPDGTVSNVTVGAFQPAIIFKTDKEDACFKFVDWLTSAEIQEAYGREVENLLGVGARYFTANLEAVNNLNWSVSEAEVITSQMKQMTCTPNIPASYYVARNIQNAFRRVINKGYHPRESILMYKEIIDSEITRKNAEIKRQAERVSK